MLSDIGSQVGILLMSKLYNYKFIRLDPYYSGAKFITLLFFSLIILVAGGGSWGVWEKLQLCSILGIRMRIMPRARCIQYTCNDIMAKHSMNM